MNYRRKNNLTQSRKGAKGEEVATSVFSFAPLRLCVRLYFLFPLLLNQPGFADPPPPDRLHDQARIMAEITSPDAKRVQAEIAELRMTMNSDPGFVIGMMRGPVLRALIDHGHFKEAADLATLGVLSNLNDLGSVQQLQRLRVEALVRANKPTEALGAAKALFNVCSVHDTEQMLQVLAETINAAHPTDPNAAQPLVVQERAGAVAKDQFTATTSSIERSLPADMAYRPSADQRQPGSYLIPSDEWGAINSQVNLLLLADEPSEAVKLLRTVRNNDHFINPRDIDEALARSIRAEDGTIGRANAFIRARNAEYAASP
jgi:hypothetical protein